MLIDLFKVTHSHGAARIKKPMVKKPKIVKPKGVGRLKRAPAKGMKFMKADAPPKPYGDVKYADAAEGKYPIDTEEHIRAAWNYINKPKNAGMVGNASAVKSKIIAAWKKKIDPAGPPSIQKIFLGDVFNANS